MAKEEDLTRAAGRDRKEKDARRSNLKIGKNYLLVIGIDKYSNNIPRLYNAVNDAVKFKKELVENYDFEDSNPYTIELFDEAATRKNIIQVFDKLVKELNYEDNLVFYFSGHGEYFEHIKKGYWIPVDALADQRYSYLSNDEVLSLIGSLKARHVFGIVDSCFSGALFRSKGPSSVTERIFSTPSRWLLTSGWIEIVSDGALGDHSPFAKQILSRLRNNPQEQLWGSELCLGVMKGFQYNPEKQVPRWSPLNDVGHEGGEFVFLRKNVDWQTVIEQELEQKGEIVTTTRQIAPTAPPSEISLESDHEVAANLEEYKRQLSLMMAFDDKIPEVFNSLFKKLTNRSYRTTILVRYSQYNKNKKKEIANLATAESLQLSSAQINWAFLEVIDGLTEDDVNLNK